MKRLNKQERSSLRALGNELLDLRYDEKRRLRNALLALAGLDAGWQAWVEREMPRRLPDERGRLRRITRLVEARARVLLFKHYPFVRMQTTNAIARDWPFNDDGSLTPG